MEHPDYTRLQEAAAILGEHYDSVVILASGRTRNGMGWDLFSARSGNYYTAKGMVQDWLERERISDQMQMLQQMMPPPDDMDG